MGVHNSLMSTFDSFRPLAGPENKLEQKFNTKTSCWLADSWWLRPLVFLEAAPDPVSPLGLRWAESVAGPDHFGAVAAV